MRYAQPQLVELLLSPSLSVADLQAQLRQQVGAESARAQISNRMEAQLTGSGFGIEAQMPDLQAVTSQQATRWTWKVTPTEHGPQTLHLTLSAHIDVAGRDAPLVVRTFDRDIQVNITIPQRVSGFHSEELAVAVGCHRCADRGISVEAKEESRQCALIVE